MKRRMNWMIALTLACVMSGCAGQACGGNEQCAGRSI